MTIPVKSWLHAARKLAGKARRFLHPPVKPVGGALSWLGLNLLLPSERGQLLAATDSKDLHDSLAHAFLRQCERDSIRSSSGKKGARTLRNNDVPVVVGPWLSEVGFELEYWIPFLKHYLASKGVTPERTIALSRGGAKSWYAGLANRYVDVFDLMTPQEYVAANQRQEAERGGEKKQIDFCSLEKKLVRSACDRMGIRDFVVIHPSLMYRFYRHFWGGRDPLSRVTEWSRFEPIPHCYPRVPGLPFDEYVAVKFYYSSCFPASEDNIQFVRRFLAHLTSRTNVVLLNTGLKLDDHSDSAELSLPRLFDATPLMQPRDNLAIQSALVAHSQGLYCTYGGFSYLGPLLGVKSLAFYSEANFNTLHLELAYRVFNSWNPGQFAATSTSAINILLDNQVPSAQGRRVA